MPLCLGEPLVRAPSRLRAEARLAGDHEQTRCNAFERLRIEAHRHAEHKAADPLRQFRNKAGNIPRHLGREISRRELKVLHQ